MARATTPTPTLTSGSVAGPSTPGMSVQRNTPIPSTPGHRRIASMPRTPGTSPLTTCAASPGAFTVVKVHTAKCSECDKRNMDVMRRCPGCTFQVCKPCQEKREADGRSLAHGNMVSPLVATPGAPGSVVRRRPVGVVGVDRERVGVGAKSVGLESGGQGRSGQAMTKKRTLRPAAKSKAKGKAREVTPSDNSSDYGFDLDPASPTSNKRPRRDPVSSNVGLSRDELITNDSRLSFSSTREFPTLASVDTGEMQTDGQLSAMQSAEQLRAMQSDGQLREMGTEEMLNHYGVNTPTNLYKEHLLSRHQPVVSNPFIHIPEVVKRGFRPRPSAAQIQRNIVEKVRERMGLHVYR